MWCGWNVSWKDGWLIFGRRVFVQGFTVDYTAVNLFYTRRQQGRGFTAIFKIHCIISVLFLTKWHLSHNFVFFCSSNILFLMWLWWRMPTTVGKVNGFHILWFVVIICEYQHIGERETNTSYINITHLVVEFPALLMWQQWHHHYSCTRTVFLIIVELWKGLLCVPLPLSLMQKGDLKPRCRCMIWFRICGL
jgi:hypothetical protein